MTEVWISADRVFDGVRFHEDHAVRIEGGRVIALAPIPEVETPSLHHLSGTLMPGYFDIQVNGGGGAQLNSEPTREGIERIAEAHRALGTVALLPTVITDSPDVLARAVDAAIAAQDVPGVMGLHIEGPHIALERRGTHAPEFVRPLDETTLTHVERLREAGLSVLITLATESATFEQIQHLAALGAVVSLGHTAADAATATRAVEAGVTCFTHLYNAMPPMLNRDPGVAGAGIASEAWCSIIADGIHVDPIMVTLAARARPRADRMIAVSDAMATVGGPDHFELYGQIIRVQDGRLVNAEGSLAGAHVTMAEAARNLVSYGIAEDEALRMCRHNPAELLGLWPQMGLMGLDAGDLILLNDAFDLVQVGVSAPG